jgi:hypothetical protein
MARFVALQVIHGESTTLLMVNTDHVVSVRPHPETYATVDDSDRPTALSTCVVTLMPRAGAIRVLGSAYTLAQTLGD